MTTTKQVKGFIVTSNHTFENDKPTIHLYGRLENKKSFHVSIDTYKPYFYILESDKELCEKQTGITPLPCDKLTITHKPVVKIELNNPKEAPKLRQILQDNNIACFEVDIAFTQKFLIDNNIMAHVAIEGEIKEENEKTISFHNPKLTPLEESTAKPTVFSFDIETDSKAKEIFSISIITAEHNEVIVIGHEGITPGKFNNTTVTQSEGELLEIFMQRIQELDSDIITGWNMIDFDLQVIQKRCKAHEIPFVLGRDDTVTNMRIESNFFRDSTVYVNGRVVLDGIALLKSSFIKLEDYKLNTAAKHFLDDSKLIEEDNRFEIIDELYTRDPEHFIEYNRKDSQLVYDILFESEVYELTIQRTVLTGMHMDRVKASIASFDSLYLRNLKKRNCVAPSTNPQGDEAGLGGFVLKSTPGIYTNVLVFDFKSLYPSLMRTFNIDPLSYLGTKESLSESIDTKKHIVAPNGAVFSQEEGILTNLLTTLWNAREEARKEGNELARYAIKILMNSMYGVLASPNSRFHIRNLSNAITYFGQHFIKLTVEKLEDKGYEVIYGDTDSVFVDIATDDIKQAMKLGKDIEQELNVFFKKHIKDTYHRDSILELEYEKTFMRFFMPSVRGSDEGAKKRYAGKLVTQVTPEIKTKLDFTGLEFVRRDWTEVAKTFQLTLLELLFDDKPVDEYIKDFVKDIKEQKYDEQLVYRKALRKPLESYTKTTPPHVKAARQLDTVDSKIIAYRQTIDGPQPIQKQTSQIDYDHYIEKQIKPIAQSVLKLQHKDFDEILSGTEQKGLNAFFGG
jgi:DNA polymerase-2